METIGPAGEAFTIRSCRAGDYGDILVLINAAAEVYRGVIPDDRWHEPYMPADEFASDMADGVLFSICVARESIVGVMGVQRRDNVNLIRHAYVQPEWQGRGIGSMLLSHICDGVEGPILVGTWQAAEWAIRFYERHGFVRVGADDTAPLLRTYWNVPERQIATSVVLASPALTRKGIGQLTAAPRRLSPRQHP